MDFQARTTIQTWELGEEEHYCVDCGVHDTQGYFLCGRCSQNK